MKNSFAREKLLRCRLIVSEIGLIWNMLPLFCEKNTTPPLYSFDFQKSNQMQTVSLISKSQQIPWLFFFLLQEKWKSHHLKINWIVFMCKRRASQIPSCSWSGWLTSSKYESRILKQWCAVSVRTFRSASISSLLLLSEKLGRVPSQTFSTLSLPSVDWNIFKKLAVHSEALPPVS